MSGTGNFLIKELLPFCSLVTTTVITNYVSKKLHKTLGDAILDDQKQISVQIIKTKTIRKFVGLLLMSLILLLLLSILFDFPSLLQTTHGMILEEKIINRRSCQAAMESLDYATAEMKIRKNLVGSRIFRETKTKQRTNLDTLFQKLFEKLFFRIGTIWTVLPFLAGTMFREYTSLEIGLRLPEWIRSWRPSSADIALFLPIINFALANAWCVFLFYFLWLRDRQIRNCILLSGHWYTFSHTLICFSFTLAYFYADSKIQTETASRRNWMNRNSNALYWYLAWIGTYVAISLRILASSMEFFHDSVESSEGIKSALYVVLPSNIVALLVLSRSLEYDTLDFQQNLTTKYKFYKKNAKEGNPNPETSRSKPISLLRDKTYKMGAEHKAESAGELSVKAFERVIVMDIPCSGWVYVRSVNSSGSGYVPAAFLKEIDNDDKALDIHESMHTGAEKGVSQKISEAPADSFVSIEDPTTIPQRQASINFLSDIQRGHFALKSVPKSRKPNKGKEFTYDTHQGSLFLALKHRLEENRKAIHDYEDEDEEFVSDWDES